MNGVGHRIVVGLLSLYTLLLGYALVRPLLGWPLFPLLLFLSTLSFFAFAVGHAWYALGYRDTLLFLVLTFVVSLAFESVGVLTGWVYGPYHYSNTLGLKIFGLVPVLIPLAWFMMVYTAYALAELLGHRLLRRRDARWHLGVTLLAALAMTAWDVVMDPMMVHNGHWIWEVKGAYFGIPAHNYAGWMATTLTTYGLFRLLRTERSARAFAAFRPFWRWPVWAYVVTWLANVLAAWEMGLHGPAVAGFFAMAPFALLGVGLILDTPAPIQEEEVPPSQ